MTPAIRILAKAMATAKTPEDVSLVAEAMEAAMRVEAGMAEEARGNVAEPSGRATGRRPYGMPISGLRPPPEPSREPQAGVEMTQGGSPKEGTAASGPLRAAPEAGV